MNKENTYDYKIGDIRGCRKLLDVFYDNKRQRNVCLLECIHCGSKKKLDLSEFKRNKNVTCMCQVKKHGMNKTKIYSIYANMKYRCYNSNHHEFHNYGGKGVTICEEWLGENGFIMFHKWSLENGYKEGLSIDRINSNGNYEPDNCQWITRSENTIKANKTCQHRKANNGTYFGISPENEYFEFDNAAQFGRDKNLNAAMIRNVANGISKVHKGWRFGFTNEIQ